MTNSKFAAESRRQSSQCSSALKKMKSGNSFPSGGPVVFMPMWLLLLFSFFSLLNASLVDMTFRRDQ